MKIKKTLQYVAMAFVVPPVAGLSTPTIIGVMSPYVIAEASTYALRHVPWLDLIFNPACSISNAPLISGQARLACPLIPANNVAEAP